MNHATYAAERVERISMARLWWAGPLVVAAALVANSIVREIALTLFDIPPAFHHLMWGHLVTTTIVAVGAAVVVFASVARYARRPIHLYLRIAAVVLVLSLIPNAMMFLGEGQGQDPPAVITLMLMHVVDAVICVGLLTTLTRPRGHG